MQSANRKLVDKVKEAGGNWYKVMKHLDSEHDVNVKIAFDEIRDTLKIDKVQLKPAPVEILPKEDIKRATVKAKSAPKFDNKGELLKHKEQAKHAIESARAEVAERNDTVVANQKVIDEKVEALEAARKAFKQEHGMNTRTISHGNKVNEDIKSLRDSRQLGRRVVRAILSRH